jgi:hypothetical protein
MSFSSLTITMCQSSSCRNQASSQTGGASQDFQALAQALQGGDLAGARSAFATLMQDFGLSATGQSTGGSGTSNPLGGDFQTLSTALNNGDLAGAQTAFNSLQQDIDQLFLSALQNSQQSQSTGGHHHHHHHAQGTTQTPTPATAADSSATGQSPQTSLLSGGTLMAMLTMLG